MRNLSRVSKFAVAAAAVALVLTGCSSAPDSGDSSDAAATNPSKIVIDTTSATGANEIAKVGGFFDERFAEIGIEDIEYTLLGTSSKMLEGLAAGKLDFVDIGYPGLPTGAAANVDFRVIGAASTGGGDAIFTAPDGPKTVAELKGKKVASPKGSSGWALLVRALSDAGLTMADVELIDLQPDEGQNAFLNGQVDAWAIWSGQAGGLDDSNSHVLTSADEVGLIPGAISTRTELAENDEVLAAYLGARQDAVDWFNEDPDAVFEAIAADREMEPEAVKSFIEISAPLNEPVSDELLADYQHVADLFFEEGEIASKADIAPLISTDAFSRAGL